jgi:hypothetical protein
MEVKTKEQPQRIELRSEKVRNVIGQVPPSLIRYSIGIIGLILFFLIGITYHYPYQQVYFGTVIVHQVPHMSPLDSVVVLLPLHFDKKRLSIANDMQIFLIGYDLFIEGHLLQLYPERDTLGQQNAYCRFAASDLCRAEGQTVDFKLIHSSGSLLSYMLGRRTLAP